MTESGKRRYSSTNLSSYIAKKQNEKVDKSFKKWKKESAKRDKAIELGKQKNLAYKAYESNPSDKNAKKAYKEANSAYKKALRSNTTYRKGIVKKEVLSDSARMHLSEAKRLEKQLKADPTNKELQKKYNDAMSAHDIERARARRAPEVAERRSRYKASLKRTATISVKTIATTTAVVAGLKIADKYINGGSISTENAMEFVRKAKKMASYMYF